MNEDVLSAEPDAVRCASSAHGGATRWSRRGFLGAPAAVGCATIPPGQADAAAAAPQPTVQGGGTGTTDTSPFRALDAKIQAGIRTYAIPGAAVGVLWEGQEYVKGYGVTNVDHPVPVDGDTVFRVGSTTKTFTGTTIMRLVERGDVDLDAPVPCRFRGGRRKEGRRSGTSCSPTTGP
ncbi:serine hydrolase domain-containing protein [Streptomyces canus]|uniref:serine hydrolase domain-containing protein n=1 Tax=Streptomyces canus TaxID=58343 RepID=UPI00340DA90A